MKKPEPYGLWLLVFFMGFDLSSGERPAYISFNSASVVAALTDDQGILGFVNPLVKVSMGTCPVCNGKVTRATWNDTKQ